MNRKRAGAVAQSTGKWWEERVKAENDHLRQMGLAEVIKTDAPTQTIRRGGNLTVIYTGDGPPDFCGLAVGGVPVFFETKFVASGISFAVTKPSLKSKGNWHQYEFLHRVVKIADNALVGYYLYWQDAGEKRFHFLPSFNDNGRTKRVDGLRVDSWWEALEWRKRNGPR